MPIVATAGAALGAAKELDEAVGLVAKVLGKLKANPDAAALKLTEALDEIGKTYRAVDEGIAAYLGLGLVAQRADVGSQALLAVQGGQLLAEVERGRGHCHRIQAIYRRYLDKWLAKALANDFAEIERTFLRLGEADLDLFRGLVDLARTLQAEADAVLDLILADKIGDAQAHVRASYAALKPIRQQLGDGMTRLLALRNEFLEIADIA
jgi:hypothetical protein